MNYELYIAKRINKKDKDKDTISSPIIKIAILAIAIGMAIMLVSVAVASGFQNKIRDKMTGFNGHLSIVNFDMNNLGISIQPISRNLDFYTKNTSNFKGVKNIQVFANKAGIIRTPENFEGIILKGVDGKYDFTFFDEYMIEGRYPNFELDRNKEVIISKTIADRLHIKLGDTIQALFDASHTSMKFKQRKPVVVGIFNTAFEQFDKLVVIGDLREVQYLNKWKPDQVGGFEVLLDDFNDIGVKADEFKKLIPPSLECRSVTETYYKIFDWFKLLDNNVWMIIGFVLVVALINMTTALLVLILERVQLVGILKALGASNWSIQKIFIYNAIMLVLKGLLYGNVIGFIILILQKYGEFIVLNPENYYVRVLPVNINLSLFIVLNMVTVVLCFVVLLVPSIIVTKISPSKSIKFS